MIHTIWQEIRKLWNLRNEARHGKDEESRIVCQTEHTRRETEWLYGFKSLCHPNAQRIIFHDTLQMHFHLENTLKKLQAWIQLYRSAILSSKTEPSRTRRRPPSPTRQRARSTPPAHNIRTQSTRMNSKPLTRRTPRAPSLPPLDRLSQQSNQQTSTRSTLQTDLRLMRQGMDQWLLHPSRPNRSIQRPTLKGPPKVKMKT